MLARKRTLAEIVTRKEPQMWRSAQHQTDHLGLTAPPFHVFSFIQVSTCTYLEAATLGDDRDIEMKQQGIALLDLTLAKRTECMRFF